MVTGILTLTDAVRLGSLLSAVQRNARVGWLDARDDVSTGTARAITDERGMFWTSGADVRDAYVWITTDKGFEDFRSVSNIMGAMERQEFILDYS